MNNPSLKMKKKALSRIKPTLKCRYRTEKFSFYRIKKMKIDLAFGWLKEVRKGQYNFLSMMISATLWVRKIKALFFINQGHSKEKLWTTSLGRMGWIRVPYLKGNINGAKGSVHLDCKMYLLKNLNIFGNIPSIYPPFVLFFKFIKSPI